ncbi:Na+/H+ antiporter NhaC [Sporosarcina sp. FSL K6-1522]|uniref:Na+/H+ antiporter NhaC n=1 Tax=Sporosarcina sp. FSL K6-1522 TaxID=2921554 RepID=UPI00315A18BC
MVKTKRKPTLFEAVSCLIFMGLIIGIGFGIFKIGIQILLVVSAAYAAFIGKRVGLTWEEMERGVSVRLGNVMPAIFILFAVGIVIGSWVYSGTVPMLIYYGLKFINPTYFLVTAFVIVAIVSTATGTAWGSTATAGVALMGIAVQLNIPLGMAAGAVIAGGVFGDKLSPLSDTTNLAPLVCEVNLFAHIKHMLYTTIPAALIGMIVYIIVGLKLYGNEKVDTTAIQSLMAELDSIYNWNIFMCLPFIVIFWGAYYKKPTVPIMLLSSIVAVIVGMLSNGFSFVDGMQSMVNGFNISMVNVAGFDTTAISETVLKLINRGGIFSMTTIAVTIICGYAFAGIVEVAGCLDVILTSFYNKVEKVWQLIGVTIAGSVALVFTAGVASISIIMVGTLLKDAYDKMGLDRRNLSRTLEDAGTMLLPFVPWGVSGIFYLEVLGVGPGSYWMWAVSCYLCIVFAMFFGFTGIAIAKSDKNTTASHAIKPQKEKSLV